MSRDPRVTDLARKLFEAARPAEETREAAMRSIEALARAFRVACGNVGLTYTEALDRISNAWGPGDSSRRGKAFDPFDP